MLLISFPLRLLVVGLVLSAPLEAPAAIPTGRSVHHAPSLRVQDDALALGRPIDIASVEDAPRSGIVRVSERPAPRETLENELARWTAHFERRQRISDLRHSAERLRLAHEFRMHLFRLRSIIAALIVSLGIVTAWLVRSRRRIRLSGPEGRAASVEAVYR